MADNGGDEAPGGNIGDEEEIIDPQDNEFEEEEEEDDGGEEIDDFEEEVNGNGSDEEAELAAEDDVEADEDQGEKKGKKEGEGEGYEEDLDVETSVYSFPPAGCVDPIQVPPQDVIELGGVSDEAADYPEAASVEGVDAYPPPDVTADDDDDGPTAGDGGRDDVSPYALPDDTEEVDLFPLTDGTDEHPVEFGYDFADDGDDLLAMHGRSDVTELVVLDPDHPLMATFQKALKEFLQKQLDKATLQLREATHSAKKKEQERESTGVELYGCQQDLARSQMQLEKLRDDSETAKHDRDLAEQELGDMRKAYRERQALANEERKNNADLQTQVENLNMRLFYMEDAKDNIHADIAVMKRAAEKADADVLRAEESKRIQDLFVDRLTEKMAKLQEEIALCSAQLTAQAEETRSTKESVMEARMEIEAITIEKKQLFQHWNSSLIGMKRRDEAHAAMLRALHLEQQQILTLEAELNGFRKDIQSEQETNEKLTLILKKCEDEIDRVRNNLNQTIARQEDINNESSQYMNILKQTEDALAIALREKSQHVRHLTEIQNHIENAFREKMKVEEEILETMRSQLTSDKAAQNTHKLIKRKRDEIRDLEANTVITENDISKLLLETSHLQTNIDGLTKTLSELTDEYNLKNKIITQSEHEISQRMNKIKNKKGELDLLNKKLSLLKEKTGGVEISPLEAEVNALQKSIDSEQQQIAELQHLWLRDQSELVRLCKEEEAMSQAVETLKKELTVLTQKKLRVEGEISTQRREVADVEKRIHDVQNHLVRLDTLIHRETGTEDSLANDNILRENEFMYSLKDAEKRSIEMQEKLDSLKEEKERLLNSLVEAERQIMLWEKKTQLARETRAAVDRDVGQGEIYAMRTEIHRMQVRESQLKREQEKLVQDLEKTVSRRDTITTRGEALAKSKMNFVTKGSLERQVTDLKRRIKQTRQDIIDVETEERELKEHQEQTSAEISDHQAVLQQHQYEAESLDSEVEKLLEQKHKNLADIISKQQKSKFYQQLKEGRYNRVCKSQTALDSEYQKETERMNNMITIVDDLRQKFPHAQPSLQKVVYSYGSRPDAQQ